MSVKNFWACLFVIKTFFLLGQITVNSFIYHEETKLPIENVNICVVTKKFCTVSKKDGNFELTIPDTLARFFIRISLVGFESKELTATEINKKKIIYLKPSNMLLNEVNVSVKKKKTKILGNKTKDTKNFSSLFKSYTAGSEVAIKLKITNEKTLLKKIFFNVVKSNIDKAKFELKLYSISKNGMPDKNLLNRPIVQTVNIQQGIVFIDVSKYTIYVKEDVILGLEYVDENNSTKEVFISAKVKGNDTYVKANKDDEWLCIKGYGVGLQVQVEY